MAVGVMRTQSGAVEEDFVLLGAAVWSLGEALDAVRT